MVISNVDYQGHFLHYVAVFKKVAAVNEFTLPENSVQRINILEEYAEALMNWWPTPLYGVQCEAFYDAAIQLAYPRIDVASTLIEAFLADTDGYLDPTCNVPMLHRLVLLKNENELGEPPAWETERRDEGCVSAEGIKMDFGGLFKQAARPADMKPAPPTEGPHVPLQHVRTPGKGLLPTPVVAPSQAPTTQPPAAPEKVPKPPPRAAAAPAPTPMPAPASQKTALPQSITPHPPKSTPKPAEPPNPPTKPTTSTPTPAPTPSTSTPAQAVAPTIRPLSYRTAIMHKAPQQQPRKTTQATTGPAEPTNTHLPTKIPIERLPFISDESSFPSLATTRADITATTSAQTTLTVSTSAAVARPDETPRDDSVCRVGNSRDESEDVNVSGSISTMSPLEQLQNSIVGEDAKGVSAKTEEMDGGAVEVRNGEGRGKGKKQHGVSGVEQSQPVVVTTVPMTNANNNTQEETRANSQKKATATQRIVTLPPSPPPIKAPANGEEQGVNITAPRANVSGAGRANVSGNAASNNNNDDSVDNRVGNGRSNSKGNDITVSTQSSPATHVPTTTISSPNHSKTTTPGVPATPVSTTIKANAANNKPHHNRNTPATTAPANTANSPGAATATAAATAKNKTTTTTITPINTPRNASNTHTHPSNATPSLSTTCKTSSATIIKASLPIVPRPPLITTPKPKPVTDTATSVVSAGCGDEMKTGGGTMGTISDAGGKVEDGDKTGLEGTRANVTDVGAFILSVEEKMKERCGCESNRRNGDGKKDRSGEGMALGQVNTNTTTEGKGKVASVGPAVAHGDTTSITAVDAGKVIGQTDGPSSKLTAIHCVPPISSQSPSLPVATMGTTAAAATTTTTTAPSPSSPQHEAPPTHTPSPPNHSTSPHSTHHEGPPFIHPSPLRRRGQHRNGSPPRTAGAFHTLETFSPRTTPSPPQSSPDRGGIAPRPPLTPEHVAPPHYDTYTAVTHVPHHHMHVYAPYPQPLHHPHPGWVMQVDGTYPSPPPVPGGPPNFLDSPALGPSPRFPTRINENEERLMGVPGLQNIHAPPMPMPMSPVHAQPPFPTPEEIEVAYQEHMASPVYRKTPSPVAGDSHRESLSLPSKQNTNTNVRRYNVHARPFYPQAHVTLRPSPPIKDDVPCSPNLPPVRAPLTTLHAPPLREQSQFDPSHDEEWETEILEIGESDIIAQPPPPTPTQGTNRASASRGYYSDTSTDKHHHQHQAHTQAQTHSLSATPSPPIPIAPHHMHPHFPPGPHMGPHAGKVLYMLVPNHRLPGLLPFHPSMPMPVSVVGNVRAGAFGPPMHPPFYLGPHPHFIPVPHQNFRQGHHGDDGHTGEDALSAPHTLTPPYTTSVPITSSPGISAK